MPRGCVYHMGGGKRQIVPFLLWSRAIRTGRTEAEMVEGAWVARTCKKCHRTALQCKETSCSAPACRNNSLKLCKYVYVWRKHNVFPSLAAATLPQRLEIKTFIWICLRATPVISSESNQKLRFLNCSKEHNFQICKNVLQKRPNKLGVARGNYTSLPFHDSPRTLARAPGHLDRWVESDDLRLMGWGWWVEGEGVSLDNPPFTSCRWII